MKYKPMKRRILICLLAAVCATSVVAQEQEKPDYRGFGYRWYSLSFLPEYAYNRTWGSMANFNIMALLPLNQYFEAEAKVQLSTANVYTTHLVMRPKFSLPAGELFIDGGLYYRSFKRSNQWQFVGAVSLGYRMDYISAQVGFYGRVMDQYKREWHSEEAYNSEPFNLLYRLQVFARPQRENWNLSLAITNMDDFQYERMWAPFFQLEGRYDINEFWRIHLDTELKLAGMFHLNAEFYSAYVRAGFTYRF